MTAEFIRDSAATAAIFGFFASGWFGWAQEKTPQSWRRALIAASILSLLTGLAGGALTWQRWSDGSAIDSETGPVFGIIVGVEFAVAGLGAGALAAWRKNDLIPAWIALVVGVHLFPLAPLLNYPLLFVAAALVTMAALAAIPVARSYSIAVSAVTGLTVGTILLASALLSLATVVL